MKNTKNCVYCGKEAKSWSSHVRTKRGKIIAAGWCDAHRKLPSEGYVGNYQPWMKKWEDK